MKRNFLKSMFIAGIIAGTMLLSACNSEETGIVTQSAAAIATSAPASTPANSDLETVVLYSNAISDGRGEWIQDQALEIGIDLQLVSQGGVGLANRLVAERYNPMADVVFGLNQLLWADMVAESIITPFVPTWASEVPSHLNHSNGYFHAVALVANLLAYDTAQVDAGQAPTDWLDLWTNPNFHGLYATPNALTGSTTHMVLSGIFARFLDPDGLMGVSDEGWAHIAAKYRYATVVDQDIFGSWVDPALNTSMGQIWHMGIPTREEQFDLTANFVVPSVGVPFSVEGVALINGANNSDAARRFIEWFGSAEVMQGFGAAFEYLPANPNALHGLSDATMTIAALPEQNIDWDTVSANMGDWLEHIYLFYMP